MWLINNDVKLIRKLINWYKEARIEWKSMKWFTYFFIFVYTYNFLYLYIIFFILIFIYNFIYIFNNNSFSYKLLNFIY